MSLIQPFRALRPAPGRAAEVLAPPYDVLSSAEARERAKGKPWSFLHISKPEIDLDPNIDPYDRAVYAKAAENLNRMVAAGVLMRDARPRYYVYRLTWRDRVQTGLAAIASIADYETNRIRKHELTTPVKEDDRVRQIEAINAQTGPVMIAYPDAPVIDAMLAGATARAAAVDVTADDGVRHQMWVIEDEATIAMLTRAFDALPAIYIADGHHRSAAAARVAKARSGKPGAHDQFLAVIFPHHQMTILDYNRVVKDLNGRSPEQLLAELRKNFSVEASDAAGAARRIRRIRHVSRRPLVPADDPARARARTIRSAGCRSRCWRATCSSRCSASPISAPTSGSTSSAARAAWRGWSSASSSGEMAAAFALYPTQMTDLMAVADAGEIMPPKSTWFEPKLADGMVNHVLD